MGDVLRVPGENSARWRVLEPRSVDGWRKLFSYETHEEIYRSTDDINGELVAGKIVLDRKASPTVSAAAQADPALDEKIRRAITRLSAVEELQQSLNMTFSEAYDMAKEDASKEAPGDPFPSKATMYRYLKSKRNDLPLLRGKKNSGNRTPRYSQEISDLTLQMAKEVFLKTESRWSLKDLITYVNDTAHSDGLIKSNVNISRKFIERCIRMGGIVDSEIPRMDPKLIAAGKSIATTRIMAQTPFERVEQDAVHLPFVVNTRHGPNSNVYLVHAIDCCTSMPVGWRMVIGAPSESESLHCIETILFSKKGAFTRLGLNLSLDIYGTPHQLIFDNGPETRGERIRKLTILNIDIKHCKSRHAHGKPFIERLNRSLKEALQILPGCTRLNGRDGQRDPLKLGDKLMSPEDLERWVVDWYYRSWANTPLERLSRTDFHNAQNQDGTPRLRWKKIVEDMETPLPLPPSLKEWRMALYQHYDRKLSRKTGITVKGRFSYRGPALRYLLEKYGESSVKVLVDPDDYRQVFVYDGEDRPLVPLTEEFVDEATPAYTFSQMRDRLAEAGNADEGKDDRAAFRRDIRQYALGAEIKSPGKKKRRHVENKEVTNLNKQSSALRRAHDTPLLNRFPGFMKTNRVESSESDFSFDEVSTLPVLSRSSGREIE